MTVGKINISDTLKKIEAQLEKEKSISSELKLLIELMITVINLLVAKLGLNSENSSTPPSKDRKRKRGSKKKAKGIGRKPGGQKGRNGSTLEKVDDPDVIETIEVDMSTLPKGNYSRVGFETRQVIDIEISRIVTEYRAEILEGADGYHYVASFPDGVTNPVQYGASVKAQSVYMSQQQLIPVERVCDYFASQCGIPLSSGSVFNFNKQAYRLLERFETIAKQQLIQQYVLNADETGINVNGKLTWLHSVGNELWTLFSAHEKRGAVAMKDIGVLSHFNGILCHDHWKPYFVFGCQHALCNAHHLRELERAREHDNQKWAGQLQKLLVEIKDAAELSGGELDEATQKKFLKRYRTILTKGKRECPLPAPRGKKKAGRIAKSKSRNLLERLIEYETETLRFMTDAAIPFTNNQGENDIRMTKVQQKISGCFRSLEGAKIFCRIRSYLLTCRKHEVDASTALNLLFNGSLPEFLRQLE